MKDAAAAAGRGSIDSICNESAAAMIAAGGTRKKVQAGVNAFRSALIGALPHAVESVVMGRRVNPPDHRVRLTDALPLGSRAQAAPR